MLQILLDKKTITTAKANKYVRPHNFMDGSVRWLHHVEYVPHPIQVGKTWDRQTPDQRITLTARCVQHNKSTSGINNTPVILAGTLHISCLTGSD